jgi:hypothetical protein
MIEYDFGILLGALLDASIEFVVVGGLSATLNGAPINTFDVDVVHRRTSENVDRLIPLLESLDAVYRIQPARRLRPVRSAPLSTGRQNLLTRYGPLDLLGEIGTGLGYYELIPRSTEMLIAENVRARILNLETLIEVKEQRCCPSSAERSRAKAKLIPVS